MQNCGGVPPLMQFIIFLYEPWKILGAQNGGRVKAIEVVLNDVQKTNGYKWRVLAHNGNGKRVFRES